MSRGRRHGPGDWLLAGAAWLLLGLMRLLLVMVPFKRMMELLRMRLAPEEVCDQDPAPVPVSLDDPAIGRLPWAIAAAMRRTPWESKCLAQALTGATMLRMWGVPSLVFFGVRPAKAAEAREMTAHAWLVSDGRILTGAGDHESHAVVAVYSTWRQ